MQSTGQPPRDRRHAHTPGRWRAGGSHVPRSRDWSGWSAKPRWPKSWSLNGSELRRTAQDHDAWVGRLELWPTAWSVPWSWLSWRADLRFLGTRGDRSCPLHSSTSRLRVYPPCTSGLRPIWSQTLRMLGASRCERSTGITPPVAVVPGWAARTELAHQWERARPPARPRWWQGSW